LVFPAAALYRCIPAIAIGNVPQHRSSRLPLYTVSALNVSHRLWRHS